MYPHTPYPFPKNHLNRRTFSFDFCHENEKTSKIAQNLTPFWPLYIFTFQKWKGQFWKKSFFGEMGKMTFSDLKNENFQIWKNEPPFLSPITRDIKTNWKSSIYRKVEILYIIGGIVERRVPGGETIDQCVYIEQRRSYDARRKRKIGGELHGEFGEGGIFGGERVNFYPFFTLSKANFFEKLASTLTASISAPLQDRNFKFCRHIPYPTH